MTKDESRGKRRLWRNLIACFALYILCTSAFAAMYPERMSARAGEANPVSSESTIPEIVSEAQNINFDAPASVVEVVPETISAPAEEAIPLSYSVPSEPVSVPVSEPEVSADRELLAQAIEAESGNQCLEGRIGVGNVVMNRVKSAYFPDSVYDVLYQYDDRWGGWQFSTAPYLESTVPSELSYEAADAVLAGENVLPEPKDGKLVVFFSRAGENSDVAIIIEDHVFCYAYRVEP